MFSVVYCLVVFAFCLFGVHLGPAEGNPGKQRIVRRRPREGPAHAGRCRAPGALRALSEPSGGEARLCGQLTLCQLCEVADVTSHLGLAPALLPRDAVAGHRASLLYTALQYEDCR